MLRKIKIWVYLMSICLLMSITMGSCALDTSTESSNKKNETEDSKPVVEHDASDIEDSNISFDDVSDEGTSKDENSAPEKPKEEQNQEEVHVHSYKAATCTAPKTCSCGATEGQAVGHDWKAATCTSAKKCSTCGLTEGSKADHSWKAATCVAASTCSVCGTTSGSAKGHHYSGGKCSACGTKDPNYTTSGSGSSSTADGDPDNDDSSGAMVYRTPSGKRYHLDPQCGGKNSYSVSLGDAKRVGLTPCKKCA